MAVEFRQVSYAHESDDLRYPFWRVDYKVHGEPKQCYIKARTAIDAQQAVCRALGVPYRAI